MSDPRLAFDNPQSVEVDAVVRPLGRLLVESGLITQADLINALGLQRRVDAQLGDILQSEGLVTADDVLDALSIQHNAQRIDLQETPPRLNMADALPAALCLQNGVVPWLWVGRTLLVATSQPATFDHLRACLGPAGFSVLPVIASPLQIQAQLNRLYGHQLAQKALTRVPASESCRSWGRQLSGRSTLAFSVLAFLVTVLFLFPHWTITIGVIWAVLTLALTTGMKGAAFFAQILHKAPDTELPSHFDTAQFRLPRVSVMVPLLRENEIAGALIKRLSRLTYPKSLLNVVLVLEANDTITRDTIACTKMPDWISVIEVPDSEGPTTKPRALNYALDFCPGRIIGVWDAEDSPAPDQIEKVVMRFQQAPANVACLQGILDYYNSRTNWLSRCFTIEYATWWRLVLPGIAKLGFVIPLGGTTLFFKRDILEKLGGWDAHNVTEDADLGVRLARHGYVTELLPTVTHEEANCRAWPWVRQRSRWLKGFMITYFVHMRNPRQLIKDLGFARFMGLQMIFLATFSQFAFAPLLWSFWVTLMGGTHPVATTLGAGAVFAIVSLFVLSEILSITMGVVAVSGKNHRHLVPWVLLMPVYFTMGALASYKALYEMIVMPFYWDKTEHGVTKRTD